jgi:hypothetical protein
MTNLIIIVALIVLTAFNVYYLFYFKSLAKKSRKVEELDNYYKLDAKIELFKYLSVGLISIAALFGVSKFTDLSDKLKKVETIDEQYIKLKMDYDILSKDQTVIIQNSKEIKDLYSTLLLQMKDIQLEFYKQDQKIREATRQIPEANIRVLTRQLIETNLRDVGTQGLITDAPDSVVINKEIMKSREMLKSAGFSSDEIEEIIKEIRPKY